MVMRGDPSGQLQLRPSEFNVAVASVAFSCAWYPPVNEDIAGGFIVGGSVTMYLDYNGWALGTVYAYGGFEQSDLRAAGVWIK